MFQKLPIEILNIISFNLDIPDRIKIQILSDYKVNQNEINRWKIYYYECIENSVLNISNIYAKINFNKSIQKNDLHHILYNIYTNLDNILWYPNILFYDNEKDNTIYCYNNIKNICNNYEFPETINKIYFILRAILNCYYKNGRSIIFSDKKTDKLIYCYYILVAKQISTEINSSDDSSDSDDENDYYTYDEYTNYLLDSESQIE